MLSLFSRSYENDIGREDEGEETHGLLSAGELRVVRPRRVVQLALEWRQGEVATRNWTPFMKVVV